LEPTIVNRIVLSFLVCISTSLPLVARAAVVASTSIPDGTYTAKVVKVIDSKHVDVTLDNGNEATLPAGRATVDFSKVQANDTIKFSLISGSVVVYLDLTSH
jgi:hypothetical protein